ncbi:MAG TPA: hypothetical protein VI504_03475 [Candidatus Eisenbacteria bacterium]|jgi:hypothetical protein
MHPGRGLLVAIAAITPFSITLHDRGDTLATVTTADGTQFEIAGGAGEYAFISRGCNGEVIRRHPAAFREGAVRVQQPLGHTGLALGVRAGTVRDDLAGGDGLVRPDLILPNEPQPPRELSTNRYLNPYFTYDTPGSSVGLGYVWHEREFPTAGEGARELPARPMNLLSAHLRIGSEQQYFETRWMEGMPLYADGGMFNLGVGGRPGDGPVTFFTGLGAGGPYEGAGLALRVGYDVGDWNVSVRSRFGNSGGANASGLALGLKYAKRTAR